MKLLIENWRKYLIKEFGGDPPMNPDELRDHQISHAADREALKLTNHFRKLLKREVGRVWGDEAIERREEEAKENAAATLIPQLIDELKGASRPDKIKYLVYVLDNLRPGFYVPSEEEKAGAYGDPAEAGAAAPLRLAGTIPSLNIDLGETE
jgi:hypothetical protein